MTIHEDWNPNRAKEGNDIALIKLPRRASIRNEENPREMASPICLAWKSSIPLPSRVGSINAVLGWGRTNNNRSDEGVTVTGGSHSAILQKIEVPVLTEKQCKQDYRYWYGRIGSNKNSLICAGGQPGGECCLLKPWQFGKGNIAISKFVTFSYIVSL